VLSCSRRHHVGRIPDWTNRRQEQDGADVNDREGPVRDIARPATPFASFRSRVSKPPYRLTHLCFRRTLPWASPVAISSIVSIRQLSKAACLSPFRPPPAPLRQPITVPRICRIEGLATLATAIQQLSQSAAAKPKVFSTCRGTARPKNPATSTAAKITTAIIFFIRSFRKALKLNRLPLSLRGEALGPC
jgi:hypothetical protein